MAMDAFYSLLLAVIASIAAVLLVQLGVMGVRARWSPQKRFEQEFERLLADDHRQHQAASQQERPFSDSTVDYPWMPDTQAIQDQAWINTTRIKR